MAESSFGATPLNKELFATQRNFFLVSFFLVGFSALFWLDYFLSLGQAELNPLYSATNKFIFYPIIVVSVIMLYRFFPKHLKFASVFLVSLFAFAFLWNIGIAEAQTVLVDRLDATHSASGYSTSSTQTLMIQKMPTTIQGSTINSFVWRIGCQNALNVSYGIFRYDGSNLIISVLGLSFKDTAQPSQFSTTGTDISFNFTSPPFLEIVSSGGYAIFVNATTTAGTCNNATAGMGTQGKLGSPDTPDEFLIFKAGTDISSNYLGISLSSHSGGGTPFPTTRYRVLGTSAVQSNQTSTSTCNALNGQSCSTTTTSLTFPSDCSTGSFLANLNHNLNLFNGTNQSQIATATTEFILPSSNQFSNITIVDWTNQTSRNLNLTFSKTNYNSGDAVQGRCSLNLNNVNSTSGISTCGLAISCVRSITSESNETSFVITEPFEPIDEENIDQLVQEIINIFLLTPFMLFTLVAIAIAGYVALAFKEAKEHSGTIFISIFLVLAVAFTIMGIYPLFVGIIIILVLAMILAKMILGFIKGG